MNNPRTKRLPRIIVGQSLVALFIFVVAGYLIVYALGYKINLSARKFVKTGLIVMSIDPKPDVIKIGGREVTAKSDISVSLEPGYYDITVSKAGYQDWTTRSEIKAEIVNYYKYVELFKTPQQLEELTDSDSITVLNTPSAALAVNSPKDLSNNDYEIWIRDTLVTRFSEKISQVAWYPDNHHIIFQQKNEIHIIDEYGSNNKTLVSLPANSVAKFIIANKNQEILISQDGKYYKAEIQ